MLTRSAAQRGKPKPEKEKPPGLPGVGSALFEPRDDFFQAFGAEANRKSAHLRVEVSSSRGSHVAKACFFSADFGDCFCGCDSAHFALFPHDLAWFAFVLRLRTHMLEVSIVLPTNRVNVLPRQIEPLSKCSLVHLLNRERIGLRKNEVSMRGSGSTHLA